MTFDKSKVYTALNADELKVGSTVILANYLESLKDQVEANSWSSYILRLDAVMGTSSNNRFKSGDQHYNLAYLVSKPSEVEKWIVYLAKLQVGNCYLTACREDRWESVQKDYGAKTKLFVGSESEAEEWYKARQKFADVIKAWENGKTIQIRINDVEWTDAPYPVWDTACEYRAKPEEKFEEDWIVYLARYQDGLTLCCCDESYWETAKKFDGAKTKLFVGSEDEAKEWCDGHNKFTEVMKAWEDGKKIQFFSVAGRKNMWVTLSNPSWDTAYKYRIKPSGLKWIKWTDLEIGDVLRSGTERRQVNAIDTSGEPDEDGDVCHICLAGWWCTDKELENWELEK